MNKDIDKKCRKHAMDKSFCFTIKVVGIGTNIEAAWEDAKQSAQEKIHGDNYDESEEL